MRAAGLAVEGGEFQVLRGVASAAPLKHQNQDRARVWGSDSHAGSRGVVLGDGVGLFLGSGDVAEQAVSAGAAFLEGCTEFPKAIHELVHSIGSSIVAPPSGGATTLIAMGAKGSTGEVAWTFAGNGALLEVIGLDLGTGHHRVLWVNHLMAHTSIVNGRDALTSWIPAPSDAPVVVTNGWLRIPPGTTRLFLAVSDGILTEEARRVGRVGETSTWSEVPRPLASILLTVQDAWGCLEELQGRLEDCLEDLAADGVLDDDSTVGAVLLRPLAQAGKSQ